MDYTTHRIDEVVKSKKLQMQGAQIRRNDVCLHVCCNDWGCRACLRAGHRQGTPQMDFLLCRL